MKTIALCLSGGGYRAAAFHLGVLRALEKLSLLSSVKYLSTASGGTILAARWLVGMNRAESFADFDQEVLRFLSSTNVVQRAVDELGESKKLIREAADVYDELLGGMKWGALQRGQFDEVCFNATDFLGGGAFRFVKSSNDKVWVGNKERKVAESALREMRVGDVVASSSCFPGAFEPIVFPRDFNGVVADDITWKEQLPLMDGGIYDNQGISSVLLVLKRERPPDIDLFLVADTDQKGDVYKVHDGHKVPLGGLTLRDVSLLFTAFTGLAAVIGTIGLVAAVFGDARVVGACAAIGCGFIAALLAWLRLGVWPQIVQAVPWKNPKIWRAIESLTVNEAVSLVSERAESVLALTMRAFMQRIRALTYEKVFGERKLTGKVCALQIYALLEHTDQRVRQIAESAHKTATALWIDGAQLKDVTTCGELTAYAMIRQRAVDDGDDVLRAKIDAEWNRLLQQ